MSSGVLRATRPDAIDERGGAVVPPTDFDDVVVPHLGDAHRLAWWLTRNEHDAEDAVQEALLRAFRYFRTFTGGNGRAWFLRIVRNTCYGRRGGFGLVAADMFDEERHSDVRAAADPESLLLQSDVAAAIDRAMDSLPDRLRELLMLRELDGLSYQQMAEVMGVPMGTVMSGLSRARRAFRGAFTNPPSDSGMTASDVFENRSQTRRWYGPRATEQ